MELEKLYELMSEFRKSGLGKLEYTDENFSISMEMPQPAAPAQVIAAAPAAFPQGALSAAAQGGSTEPAAAAAGSAPEAAPAGAFIRSPLVGTFYAAPGEDSAPYVSPGSSVKKGDTVCIVEAMKMMNEVVAPYDCIIEEVLKENATAAGFDEPLFRIREI